MRTAPYMGRGPRAFEPTGALHAMTTRLSLHAKSPHAYPETIQRLTELLQTEGFGILNTIDLQAKFKEKLGRDSERYQILGACNPTLAWDAVHAVPEIGVLLPCSVVVRESRGAVLVDIMDPTTVLGLLDHPRITALAQETRTRLERVIAAL